MLVINITKNLLCEKKKKPLELINRTRMCEASEFKGKHLQDITEKQIKHTKLNLTQWKKRICQASQSHLEEAQKKHLEGEKTVNSRVDHQWDGLWAWMKM